MKILLIYLNNLRMLAAAPLGASLVASRLRKDGHEVRLLDLMFAKDPAAEAAQAARQFTPDLVAYSIRNRDNQDAAHLFDALPLAQSVVSAVSTVHPTPTLLGGTAFTTFPAQYLRSLKADYGIAGDDLEPISRFVATLAAGEPDLTTPGLVYREGGEIRSNPFQIRGYAGTSFDGWDMINLRPYRRSFSAYWDAGLVVRTGCPFECVFCDTHVTYGKEWVYRDPRQVADELATLGRKHGARSVFLADSGFNRPLDHAKAVLEQFIRTGNRVKLSCVFEPGEVDEEFARMFRRAGGVAAMLFAFSLSDRVLAASKKPFVASDVFKGAELLERAGIAGFLFLGFGGPGETHRTVQETVDGCQRLRCSYTLPGRGFRVQPQTALYDIAVSEGILPPGDDCFNPTFYHSPETSASFLDGTIKQMNARNRGSLKGLLWMASTAWDKLRP